MTNPESSHSEITLENPVDLGVQKGDLVRAGDPGLNQLIGRIDCPLYLVEHEGEIAVTSGEGSGPETARRVVGFVPAINPKQMGDPGFTRDLGLRYPFISGAMANGIGSVEIAVAMGKAGMLGFFGAAGLSPQRIEAAVNRMRAELGDAPFGVNLIHAPQEPQWEEDVVDLLLRKEVGLIEASAYLALTLPVVRYRVAGIYRNAEGRIVTPNRIVAKISRIEVATRFLSPPPEKFLKQLVERGDITADQAQLARSIPMAQDLTAEADSGGHTDNRPAIALLPTITALKNRLTEEFGYDHAPRVGLAGGISTPESAAAAFAMGAAFVLVGSVNQSCIESGTSDTVRKMLAEAEQADIAMAPAADMFEMGVNLQVLKRGTMFPMRAAKLYDTYRTYTGLDQIPVKDRTVLEKTIFQAPLETIWESTKTYFQSHDPRQIERAERDPKHKMALVFRWYLGKSSNWANSGDPGRRIDYQVWCGPAMGAFNEWVRGTFLEAPQNRRVVSVAQNILYGAAVIARRNSLTTQGVAAACETPAPVEAGLEEFFN